MPSQRLTDKGILGLKAPRAGQFDVWDSLVLGLGMRVGKKTKTFFVGTRINGKYQRFTLKPSYPAIDLATARKRAREIIADAQAGIGPEVRKKSEAKNTFGAVCESFMQDYAQAHRSRRDMQRKINRDLAVWHDRPIASITRAEIKELLRVKARTAKIAANRLKSLISKIFVWALKEEIIDANPATLLDPPGGKEESRDRNLSEDEIRKAWAAFDKMPYPYGPTFKMLLLTGQRRSEVGGLRWSEISDEGWRLPNERAKTGKGHLVPLSSLAREILADLPQRGDCVFGATSRKDTPPQRWSKAKAKADQLANIAEWHTHDLRRTFATQMRSIGVDRLVVSKLLNQAEGGVTRIYDRYSADPEKAAAMERWASRLREITSGEPVDRVVQMRKRT
jgi:integrase